MMLDEGQLRQLVQRGYVVLDAFIDPALTAAARDRLWEYINSLPRMRREDPSTHIGPFSEDEHTTDPTGNRRYGFRWQVTVKQPDILGIAGPVNLAAHETDKWFFPVFPGIR